MDHGSYGQGEALSFSANQCNAFTVHVDGDLAFVRAGANRIVDDEVRSNNIDYFTLIRVNGTWKFVNASFVVKPSSTAKD